MSRPLLARLWAWNLPRLVACAIALFVWGYLMPVVYHYFAPQVRQVFDLGIFPKQISQFGGGDLFTLPGTLALGYVHPIFVMLVGVFAVGLSATAVAGERQRGTLEILLARPVPRTSLWATHAVVLVALVALCVVAGSLGMVVGAAQEGVLGDIRIDGLALAVLNGTLLYAALASFGLAASVTFDRSGPAVALSLAWTVLAYFLQVIGSLWPPARDLQPWSLFHYFQPADLLVGTAHPGDLVVLAVAIVVPACWALAAFPRRDIPAPS